MNNQKKINRELILKKNFHIFSWLFVAFLWFAILAKFASPVSFLGLGMASIYPLYLLFEKTKKYFYTEQNDKVYEKTKL